MYDRILIWNSSIVNNDISLSVPESKPPDQAENEHRCWSEDENFPLLQSSLAEVDLRHLSGRGGSGQHFLYHWDYIVLHYQNLSPFILDVL